MAPSLPTAMKKVMNLTRSLGTKFQNKKYLEQYWLSDKNCLEWTMQENLVEIG
jgi:hypothetical protein